MFRYAATVADEVDESALQHALEKTVDIFPSFNVCLRSGMFWHYLEQAAEPPAVRQESLPICFGLHVDAKSILFRVSYYRRRINFEVSHMVSDGRGALNFFKALLNAYAQERYGVEDVPLEYDGSDHQKSEDSFDKYYQRDKNASPRAPKVYRLSGWRDEADPTFIEYHLSAQKVLDLAHSYGVSLTSLVIAAIICAIRTEMPRRDRHRTIRIDIPVDLRQFFESTTTKNFFGLAYVTYVPGDEDEPVEKVAAQVQEQIKVGTQAEHVQSRVNRMIALEKNPFLRLSPLFVKDIVLEIADRIVERETTTTVSSLGRIVLDERVAPYVSDISVMTSAAGMKLVICTFEDDLSIGISTTYSNPNVVKNFCRFFSAQGIEGRININKTSEEVAEDHLEAKIEASVKRLGGQAPAGEEDERSRKNIEKAKPGRVAKAAKESETTRDPKTARKAEKKAAKEQAKSQAKENNREKAEEKASRR